MSFTLLGALRVARDSVELDPGPKQQRLILAMLLARAGTWVGTSDLVEFLWGEKPPGSSANTVHRYVGGLRRMMEPHLGARANGRWLLGEPGRYRIDVDAASLDLLRFRDEIDRSRQAAATGHRGEALNRAVSALDLWRDRCAADLGEALTGHPVFVALEDECTEAVRHAAGLALAEGRPGAVLPAARRSAGRRPLDERLHGLLMALLAADGQTGEAIQVFRDVSRRLADRLGVEPGADLEAELRDVLRRTGEEIEAGVIRHAAAPGTARGSTAAPIRPAQLPADHAFFAGRQHELRTLTAYARSKPASLPIIGIDGIPGVGKTTLAVHLAHQLAGDYPDGSLYLDLRGFDLRRSPVRPAEALPALLSAVGVVPPGSGEDLEALAALYRSTLADRAMLILLDNADDADQVRPLLPGSPNCLVVVTSRARLSTLSVTTGAHLLTLGVPGADEARDALRAQLAGDSLDGADAGALDEMIERCGRLPFAMSLVAARLHDTPVSVVLAELRAERGGLDVFADANLDNALRAVFAGSYDRLSPDAARLFRLLSVHPGPDYTQEAMASLLGAGAGAVRPLLHELVHTRLVTQPRPRRFQAHLLVMAYATELAEADPPTVAETARTHLYDYYEKRVRRAGDLVASGDRTAEGEASGASWLIAEHDVLRAVIEDAARHGEARRVWRLTLAMQHFYQRQVWWRQWRHAAQFALDVAIEAGDVKGEAQMRRSLAGAYFFLKENDLALAQLEVAGRLFEQEGMGPDQAMILLNLCRVLLKAGEHRQAYRHYRKAAVLMRRLDMVRARVTAMQVMAWAFAETRPRLATRFALRTVQICEERNEDLNLFLSYDPLAKAALVEGRLDDALYFCRRGMALMPSDNRLGHAETLTLLGDILTRFGRTDEARDAWLQVLTHSDDLELSLARDVLDRLRAAGHLSSAHGVADRRDQEVVALDQCRRSLPSLASSE